MGKSFPYRLVSVVFLGWTAINFPRMLVSPLLPMIKEEFHVLNVEAALLLSAYLLPYAVMQIPAGSLSDRFGNKLFMALAMLGTASGSLFICFTTTFDQVIVIRILAGLLSGFWFTSSMNMISQHTGSSQLGKAQGIAYTGATISSVLIYGVVGALSTSVVGWRFFFVISFLPGFLALVLIFLFTKDLKKSEKRVAEEKSQGSLIKLVRTRSLAFALIINSIASLAGWGLGAFLPTYLVQARGLSVAETSTTMILLAISSVFTMVLGGYMTDHFGFKLPAVVSTTVMCLVSLLIPVSPLGVPLWILLAVWGLIGGWTFMAFNLLIAKTVPTKLRGTFLGAYNGSGFVSATIGPPLFGYIIDVAGFASFFTLSLVLYATSLIVVLFIR